MLNIPEEIKQKLLEGCNKNFRVLFPNGEHSDITNENIVSESVSFTESICSQSELKFGLCESPVIEFETFGIGKIKGCEIECSLEIPTTRNVEQIAISDYYDYPTSGKFAAGDVVKIDLMKPIADAVVRVRGWLVNQNMQTDDNQVFYITWTDDMNKTSPYGQSTQISIEDVGTTLASVIVDTVYPIPLGRFVVDSCKKQADMTHRRIIAYGINEIPSISISDKIAETRTLRNNTNYTYDLAKRMFTYMPNVDLDLFSSHTEVSMVESSSSTTLFSADGRVYSLTVKDKVLNDISESNDLYLISAVQHSATAEKVKNELIPLIRNLVLQHRVPWTEEIEWYINYQSKYSVEGTWATTRYDSKVGYNNVSRTFTTNNSFCILPKIGTSESHMLDFRLAYGIALEELNPTTGNIRTLWEMTTANKNDIKAYKVNHSLFGKVLVTEERTRTDDAESGFSYKWSSSWNRNDAINNVQSLVESFGMFGKTDRQGKFGLLNLKDHMKALYPSETLYPSDSLYPGGVNGGTMQKSGYESIWYDDDYTLPVGAVSVTYNNGTENSNQVVYAEGYDKNTDTSTYITYDLTNNGLFKHTISNENAKTILEAFIENASGISYMPSEIEMQGRPDLEAGDVLEIATTDETITTIILSRTMNGIQALFDSVKSD